MTARRAWLVGLALLALGGCGGADELIAPVDEPTSGVGLAYASGDVVVLPDGSEVDAPGVEGFVVAGAGVFWTDADGTLRTAGPDTEPATVDAPLDPDTLMASADGRWVAWIEFGDTGAGEPAEVVALDTTTGVEVLRSSEGMDVDEGEILVDLYDNHPPAVVGIGDDRLWVDSASGGNLLFDLTDPEQRPTVLDPDEAAEWETELYPPVDPASPDDAWTITVTGAAIPAEITAADGAVVRPRLAADPGVGIELVQWLDEDTVVGWAHTEGLNSGLRLAFCDVPSGECTAVDEDVVLPHGAGGMRPLLRSGT